VLDATDLAFGAGLERSPTGVGRRRARSRNLLKVPEASGVINFEGVERSSPRPLATLVATVVGYSRGYSRVECLTTIRGL
jgi:hypothetical protein